MHEIRMPQMGQSVEEASIVMWLKKEGEAVSQGEPIFTIQTDKAEIECESTAAGVLRKVLVAPDVLVPVLTVVALVGTADEPLPDLAQYGGGGGRAGGTPAPQQGAAPAGGGGRAGGTPAPQQGAAPAAVSPRARAKAAELGVDASRIAGTGAGGRVIEADVVAYAAQMKSVKASPVAKRLAQDAAIELASVRGTGPGGRIMKADVAGAAKPKAAQPGTPGRVQRVPLTPMRRIIARRMSESKFSAPHYYITIEADMSAAREFRAGVTSYKLSINDLVLRATVNTLAEFPGVNARWAEDAIEQIEDVNLGIAVALPGGLIVPVLKQAQTLSLEELATQGRVLIEKARTGKLLPDDFTGNTFTVSNLGPYGVDDFTAIINQPDSGILAVGQMKDRPVAIGGGVFVRPVMKLTLSSDHRVIDGALGAQFMGRLKAILESAAF